MVDLNAPLDSLEERGTFHTRHIGPDAAEEAEMLAVVGADSLDQLLDQVTPASVRTNRPLDLPEALSETEAVAALRAMADENRVLCSMIGRGYYGTATPPVILRNVLENPGWYTAYTPYQAEVSQGRLEALLNFQQVVMDLTGLELANASLLDEATAAAEAMTMLRRVGKSKTSAFFVDADTHPQTIEVLRTRAAPLGLTIVTGDPSVDLEPSEVFGALLSYPGSSGEIRDLAPVVAQLHAAGALAAVATDLLALTMLTPPAELGADVAVGSAQRFGVPMGYGGPHAAFFATRAAYKRSIPGRIIGVSVDAHGASALRMALQTREQHIRRDKATSNICTAQALLAIMASMFAVWHGAEGLTRIAARTHRLAVVAATGLSRLGLVVETKAFFDTITIAAPGRAAEIVANAAARGVNLRPLGPDRFAMSVDETTGPRHIETVFEAVEADAGLTVAALEPDCRETRTGQPERTTPFLTHPVFASYRSETEMMRYLRRLQAKDIALDRSMIPLGSCTMKLNAAAEMIPVTWPEFGAIHPYAPADQVQGYHRLFASLEGMLAEITGFDAVSLQPNAGSQGEFAGLLAIRRYHAANGQAGRDICLIPASAHGTNPASAIMAGMKVVGVACDDAGNVDVADLHARIAEHRDALGALMITYPSTHGVFEEAIVEICAAVHEAGGQVYIDGANLNAMVGLARVAEIGGDVCHMNLHKTFCIPHGGGGPGVGPIGMKAHLAPFAPGDPDAEGDCAVAAAPFGSASILPISWAYIAMMGGEGLTRATRIAILNGNYVAARLGEHYPIVYTGAGGLVAHECIIDLRAMTENSGVTVDDVAKRLIDFGYHAPTMSWPVAGTLMIEPTESEGRGELDRFCDALIAIRAEIADIEAGRIAVADSPLRHAPHAMMEMTGAWDRAYSREDAVFPALWTRTDKFWPPVGRVDNVAGDRTLVCACPPMSAYAEAAE